MIVGSVSSILLYSSIVRCETHRAPRRKHAQFVLLLAVLVLVAARAQSHWVLSWSARQPFQQGEPLRRYRLPRFTRTTTRARNHRARSRAFKQTASVCCFAVAPTLPLLLACIPPWQQVCTVDGSIGSLILIGLVVSRK